MERIFGIIAEFNPFHNGHAAVVQAARDAGAGGVVAVLSGNFVQRGSPAIADKRVRARAALLCGVDLVLELPLPFACAPAQRFARGAVEVLAGAGCIDNLIFGSECGDIGALRRVAAVANDRALSPAIRTLLSEGMTFARAREKAVAQAHGAETASLLASPNNALAIEYLRAARQVGWEPAIHTILRRGAAHDSQEEAEGYASASLLRKSAGDFALLQRQMPPPALQVVEEAFRAGEYPADPARLESAILAHLRRMTYSDLELLPDLSEGLENRLYSAIRQASTLAELETVLKTKRYTMARVRRLIMAAFLGITREECRLPVPYLRILGMTPRGREIVGMIKRAGRLPMSQSLARLRELGGACERFADMEELATDLYALALPKPPPCGYEYSASAVILKD